MSSLGLNSRAISATRRAWLRPGTWGVSEGSPAEEANEGLAFGVAGAIAPPPRSMSVVSGAARCEPENERFFVKKRSMHVLPHLVFSRTAWQSLLMAFSKFVTRY